MTFADDKFAEAILIELRGIRTALENTAAAYTKMARLAEARTSAPAAAKEGNGEKRERKKTDPEDILTVSGFVLHFSQMVNLATGEPKLTKKGKKPFWSLKLANGFEAMVFSTTQASICSKAAEESRPLIVDYVIDGKYNNIEAVKLGGAAAPQKPQQSREAGEDDDDSPF